MFLLWQEDVFLGEGYSFFFFWLPSFFWPLRPLSGPCVFLFSHLTSKCKSCWDHIHYFVPGDLIHAVKLPDLLFYPRSLFWLKYLSQLLTRCYKIIKNTCQKLYSFLCVCVFVWFWCQGDGGLVEWGWKYCFLCDFFLKSLRRIGNSSLNVW